MDAPWEVSADINTGCTFLVGYLSATYAQIAAVFGPHVSEGDGYKVSTEWIIKFRDGTIATI